MRKAITLMLVLLAVLGSSNLYAALNVSVTQPSSSTQVGNTLPNIYLKFDGVVTNAENTLTISSPKGGSIALELDRVMMDRVKQNTIIVKAENVVTRSGLWTLHIPAGFFTDESGDTNEEMNPSWTLNNASEPEEGALTYTISQPAGDTHEGTYFPNITIDFDRHVTCAAETLPVTLSTGETHEVTLNTMFMDMGYLNSVVLQTSDLGISNSCTVSVRIPAGFFTDDSGLKNVTTDHSWVYTNPEEVVTKNLPMEVVLASSGTSYTGSTFNTNIALKFETKVTYKSTQLTVTTSLGDTYQADLNTMFMDNDMENQIIVKTNSLGINKSCDVTLHVPAGFFTDSEGVSNEESQYTFQYINPDQGGSEEPAKELVIENFKFVGSNGQEVDLTNGGSLAQFTSGDYFYVTINDLPNIKMVTLSIVDQNPAEGDDAVIRNFEITNVTADGVYSCRVAGKLVNKLVSGHVYDFIFNAYDATNVKAATASYGPVTIKVNGSTPGYQYSPYKLLSADPVAGSEIIDPSTVITLKYSGPVEVLSKSFITEGGQGAATTSFRELKPNYDKTEWTLVVGESFWNSAKGSYYFEMYVVDENGLVVRGNMGREDTSHQEISYDCFLGCPAVDVLPAAGTVDELYTFSATYGGKNIALGSALDKPYLIDARGNRVAEVDMSSEVNYDAAGKVIPADVTSDVVSAKVEFKLNKKVVAPGYYTLVVPHAAFSMGTEQTGESNKYMAIDYTIEYKPVEFVSVSLEIADYSKVTYRMVKDQESVVDLKAGEAWKVASLTLNGEDVTSSINAAGLYTLPALAADAHLVATLEYAEELTLTDVSGVGLIEGENGQVKVFNDGECIVVEGLTAGANVAVYTVNGMLITSHVATDNTVRIKAAQDVIYIVRVGEKAVKIQH